MKLFKRSSKPSWAVSLIPFVVLIATLFFVIKIFGSDALSGGSQVSLLFSAGVTVAISMFFYRIPWKDFEEAIVENISSVGSAIIILLLIGAVSGSWMVSGVVPTMIYYGMKVIYPSIFLFATCIICALVSMMTGSSWTTIATVGVVSALPRAMRQGGLPVQSFPVHISETRYLLFQILLSWLHLLRELLCSPTLGT